VCSGQNEQQDSQESDIHPANSEQAAGLFVIQK
jgi:hypothetical protein